jgi:hypothetical protein
MRKVFMLQNAFASGKLFILCGTGFGSADANKEVKTKWRRKGLQPRTLAEPLLI